MSVRLSCPSCNTAFALPALPDHRRAQCPRCGDVFPIHSYTEQPDDGAPPAAPPAPVVLARGRKPQVAFAAALLLLAAGVAFWMLARELREQPPSGPTEPPAPSATATSPAQLAGLGYLPAECNVVFAVQPGPLLAEADRTKQQPRDVLAQLGLPEQVLTALDGTGVPLAQIDHLAGGLYLNDPGDTELRVALVLVLRAPLANEDEFRAKLKARPVAGKPNRWAVELEKVPVSPLLARVSPTVCVFGLADKDIAPAERGGFGPGALQFPNLRRVIDTVPADAAVWLAADDERDWAQKPLVKLLASGPEAKPVLTALASARGAMLAVSFGEKPRMAVQVRATDTATADRVRGYFAARAAETEGAKSEAPSTTVARYEGPFDAKLLKRMLGDL